MKLFPGTLRRVFQIRRTIRALDRLADGIEAQNVLLARLADYFCPQLPAASLEDLRSTGPTFSRDAEQVQLQEFAERFHATTGRDPTEEEVLDYLHELERPH